MQEMENRRRSVNSPQRILSFSRNRKAKVFFQDDQPPHQRPKPHVGDPKTSEVYSFVGSITTVVALACSCRLTFCKCGHMGDFRGSELQLNHL
ncbi:hypothetical protein OROMI_021778 [Orobanche minor]